MNTESVRVNTVLIPDHYGCSLSTSMGSAIQCLKVDEKGFQFRRMNLFYNGETFFVAKQMLEQSLWSEAPVNSQLRFL